MPIEVYIPKILESDISLFDTKIDKQIKANKKHNDQINEKIALYRQTKSENIWQEIYLKARLFALKWNIPGGPLDETSTLKDIERLSNGILIETGYQI